MGENKSVKIRSDTEFRPVLGDVTNQLGEKGFPFVDRSSVSKPLSGNKRAAENALDSSRLSKQICAAKCPKTAPNNKAGLSPLRGGKTYRLKTGNEIKERSSSALESINLGGEDQQLVNAVKAEEDLGKESVVLSEKNVLEGGIECRVEETRGISDVGESEISPEEVGTQVLSDTGKGVGGDFVACSWSDSVETSRFADSQETRSFGLERCTLVKGDGLNSSASAGVDLLKNCSCSFCTKAAYIWSDLQCQDVKGRISILAKSRKEASDLVRKYSMETATNEPRGNSSMAPPLETGLQTLWKSLFLHMDNVYAAESSQLQSSFAVLNDVREDYKMNLAMINVMPPEMQQCSSDDLIN